jgi:diguanylate cyclase (GGDEF)-like protein
LDKKETSETSNKDLHSDHLFAMRLMQYLVVPTFVLDVHGNVIIWNKACERLTGIEAKKLIGSNNHWQAFYEEPRDCLADILVNGRTNELKDLYSNYSTPKDNQHGLSAENWCNMPLASKHLYLAIDAGPICDEEGKLIAVVETLRDMTEQKLAQNALHSLAHKDGLTELSNRRAFDDKLIADCYQAQQTQTSISLLLLDVDYFKQYNDIYGHQRGDECLKAIAKAISEHSLRPTDLTARYGGEEFAIILPGVDASGAQLVAERIRNAVYNLQYQHSASESAEYVTISIGVTSVIAHDNIEPNTLIAIADKALYQAKHSGRNRVIYMDYDKKLA